MRYMFVLINCAEFKANFKLETLPSNEQSSKVMIMHVFTSRLVKIVDTIY